MSQISLNDSLTLPCGAVLKNRIAKSAMSENMANQDYTPNEKFQNLYHTWATGGAGLLITGNVMCDKRYLGEPKNVVIENGFLGIDELKKWAQSGIINQTHLWMQINHPGKQSPKFLTKEPVSASAIALKSPLDKMFNPPRALDEKEIYDIIERFTFAAITAKKAGFTGVQIHGAHGYLINQFLSPLHNSRQDQWGGSLTNRMRLVLEIYKSMRAALGGQFPIGIKLNSADFQKGGFTEEESLEVVKVLAAEKIDLIEISGGSYEAPEMMGSKKESTIKREAYFLEYCEKIRKEVTVPLMLTGGFRSREGMESALKSNACDVVGLARSVALDPNFPNEILRGQNVLSKVKQLTTGIKAIDKAMPLEIIWYADQIHRLGKMKNTNPNAHPLLSVVKTLFASGLEGLKRVRAK
ncbi:MAG: NADH:flavin oxidoreductase/NADH oxidase family protein [Bacteriovorax sp.]|nr:NADH:flavin oxidoreductase/NADH oxidase family protein [Bacteriovorax sp.]